MSKRLRRYQTSDHPVCPLPSPSFEETLKAFPSDVRFVAQSLALRTRGYAQDNGEPFPDQQLAEIRSTIRQLEERAQSFLSAPIYY